ncbi:MAG: hypothetical protein IPK99_13750 [Flavobacteriales bacterium]|nr:hypothetical protein [Flavobacteriales bacterium]
MSAAVVKDERRLSARYLSQYLNYHKDRLLVPLMTGAANMSLSIDRIKTVPVSYPPSQNKTALMDLLVETECTAQAARPSRGPHRPSIPAIFQAMFWR